MVPRILSLTSQLSSPTVHSIREGGEGTVKEGCAEGASRVGSSNHQPWWFWKQTLTNKWVHCFLLTIEGELISGFQKIFGSSSSHEWHAPRESLFILFSFHHVVTCYQAMTGFGGYWWYLASLTSSIPICTYTSYNVVLMKSSFASLNYTWVGTHESQWCVSMGMHGYGIDEKWGEWAKADMMKRVKSSTLGY